jgi:hypothetical protein
MRRVRSSRISEDSLTTMTRIVPELSFFPHTYRTQSDDFHSLRRPIFGHKWLIINMRYVMAKKSDEVRNKKRFVQTERTAFYIKV